MGEVYKDALRVKVDQKLKIEFSWSESYQRCRYLST